MACRSRTLFKAIRWVVKARGLMHPLTVERKEK
jgi:hypothetical protein